MLFDARELVLLAVCEGENQEHNRRAEHVDECVEHGGGCLHRYLVECRADGGTYYRTDHKKYGKIELLLFPRPYVRQKQVRCEHSCDDAHGTPHAREFLK